MTRLLLQIKQSTFLSPPPSPQFLFLSRPPHVSSRFNLSNKVTPSMLLIIMILAIIFFISGLLHLLIRLLLRPPDRAPDENDDVTALHGQLQQLFHLHDAGVDQSFIDTLPVFNYKVIVGAKDAFDCAVCLCEFEGDDQLRLLPKCSHAFHVECIDTWLLSHSTCPICRASLLPDISSNTCCAPIVVVIESGSESSREMAMHREAGFGPVGPNPVDPEEKCGDIQGNEEEKVVRVKLGKFKNVGNGGEGSSDGNGDERRCFSMGSFAYVMEENSSLQVPIFTPVKKQSSKKPSAGFNRQAMSECGCDSRREFNGFEAFKVVEIQGCNSNPKAIAGSKVESLSVSKIWLRGKNDKPTMESSRRAFSFRFPVGRNEVASYELKAENGRRTASEIDMRWGSGGSEIGVDEEMQRCDSLDSRASTTSFGRRTLLWLMRKPNHVVNSSYLGDV